MRLAPVLLAAAALLPSAAADARPRAEGGEQRLARLLEGRVAGEPVNCIPFAQSRDQRVIDGTAIVYGRGRVIYVNRPTNADTLDSDDVLVSDDSQVGQVCRLDTARQFDRSNFFFTGFVGLEQFVPYRRAD